MDELEKIKREIFHLQIQSLIMAIPAGFIIGKVIWFLIGKALE